MVDIITFVLQLCVWVSVNVKLQSTEDDGCMNFISHVTIKTIYIADPFIGAVWKES